MKKFSELTYERPDKAQAIATVEAATLAISSAKTAEDAIEAILDYSKKQGHFETLGTLAHIRHDIDTENKFYEAEQEFFDNAGPELMPYQLKYAKAVVESPFRKEIAAKLGNHYFTLNANTLKMYTPELVPYLQKQNDLSREYQKLLASCKVDFMGEVRNLSGLRKFLSDPDRNVRRAAAAATSGFFAANEEKLDSLYDSLVKLRTEMGQKMGYKNYTPLGYMFMNRIGYNAEDVAKFRQQVVEEIVPVCTELHRRHAKRIGVDKMKFYDETFQFTTGNATPQGDRDFMVNAAQKMYGELSEETGDFFNFMVEHELMDLVSRPSKRVGGYCTSLIDYKAPFIFSNFNGTSADVDVLTHEAGHAFEGFCAASVQPLPEYLFPSLEACEIHSMSMEFFTHPWMELFFGEQADKYRYAHLLESLTFIPYGVCVDEFQHIVYDNPDLTPAERKAAWSKLEKKYLPHRDYDGDEFMEAGGFWQKQHHIYSMPFYYIDYCLASMAAFEFYGKMHENRDAAWADYMRLCYTGGSQPYLELLKVGNLANPFVEGGVKRAVSAGVKVLMDTDDSKF